MELVNCGCGGEAKVEEWVGRWYVRCQKSNCLISTKNCDTAAEAIKAWNRAMGKRDNFHELKKRMNMNKIKSYSVQEKMTEAFNILNSAHVVFGIQCQNCKHYDPEKSVDGYRGFCKFNEHNSYWCQYCEDFEVKDETD